MSLFPSYGANIFTLLNDDNDHYSAQWKWIMNELAAAKENGEKVSRLFTEVLPHHTREHINYTRMMQKYTTYTLTFSLT